VTLFKNAEAGAQARLIEDDTEENQEQK